MQLSLAAQQPEDIRAEVVVATLLEGDPPDYAALAGIDAALGGLIARLVERRHLRGRFDEQELIHTLGRMPAERVLIAGLGRAGDLDLKRLGDAFLRIARGLRKARVRQAALVLPDLPLGLEPVAKLAVEAFALAARDFRTYRSDPEAPPVLEELILCVRDPGQRGALERGSAQGAIVAECMSIARELGNEPGNVATPTHLAARAMQLAEAHGLVARVMDAPEIEKLEMGAFLSVARGSEEPPKLITLEWQGGPAERTLVFVGKGITFDSGGISLKPRERMGEMKFDMAGGAAVIAALVALARLKCPLRVVGLIPATENLPSGRATKPGDIVRAMSGLHIEITNTDAEGRLVLADALTYARQQYAPVAMIDVATLTGACVVALGHQAIGLMGNDQQLIDGVRAAGERVGERLWPLPLYREYAEQMRSPNADLRNSASPHGGASCAGAFLSRFTEGVPWVHLDIAGTAWIEGESDGDRPLHGATGSGVRTLVEFALGFAGAS